MAELRRAEGPVRDLYESHCNALGLRWPAGASRVLRGTAGDSLKHLVYWPDGESGQANSLEHGLALLAQAIDPPPPNLVPLMPVDDRSMACAACVAQEDWDEDDGPPGPAPCEVVRWHLGVVPEDEQGALLDTDAALYLESMAEELAERPEAMRRVMDASRQYYQRYVSQARTPRSHVTRPVQLACQNVVIGLATFEQDVWFDGLRVRDYLSCEVAHLAAHEGNRALAALMLCDAFRCGGTMEIRFGPPERERRVPVALRRFGRAFGSEIGSEDPKAVTPAEARRLFMAVTPMPEELHERCAIVFDRGQIAPERICYTLMSGVWSAIELDYLLATSPRVASVLQGGAQSEDRAARLAELESCRAATMVGTLRQRLAATDGAAGSAEGVRVFEDARAAVRWQILEAQGAVIFDRVAGPIPWWQGPGRAPELAAGGALIVVPRALPVPADLELIAALAAEFDQETIVLLSPFDIAESLPASAAVLRYPDRVRELDVQVERKLHAMRVGRA